jgi:alanine-glyoxylate transaminase / serine-glyoxylate transaminase / serine-pyruvate transaminase
VRRGRRTLQTDPFSRRIALDPERPVLSPAVLQALAQPAPARDDPAFQALAREVEAMLRHAFGLEGGQVFGLSGPAEAAVDAALLNLLQPGEAAVVVVDGPAGAALAERAERTGAEVIRVEHAPGAPVDLARVEAALWARGARLCIAVHADPATGVANDPAALCALAREHGALAMVEAAASLGAAASDGPVDARRWGAEVVTAGQGVGWSAPQGVALLALGPQALGVMRRRRAPPAACALDLSRPETALGALPGPLLCGLRAALAGHAAGAPRRARLQPALSAGLERLGLALRVEAGRMAPGAVGALTPPAVDAARVGRRMQAAFGVEVGLFVGPQGEAGWRFSLLGDGVGGAEVRIALVALAEALHRDGVGCDLALALQTAGALLDEG